MPSDSFQHSAPTTLEEAFPYVNPETEPLGSRVLIQVRRTFNRTRSGLFLVEETKETVKWNEQVGKVIAIGPVAFRNRETGEWWKEGAWVTAGDYVRVPRWGGDRIEVNMGKDEPPVTFVIYNDHELIAKVTGDPLSVKAYIL